MSLSRTSSPQQSRHRSQLSMSQQIQPPNARMSPASRYHSNLKVLRRRDPTIISIFDQFSHVCVYHHNGKKWEKQGFEGSMFLYERESYPPYGFYILNRVGSDDYIQRLYPEDDITAHGGYLMLRSYPNFTTARLDAIRNHVSDKFSPVYAYTPDGRPSSAKGESLTIGLWTFTMDGRESLHGVMSRLHSYIKKNIPYPKELCFGPDRPLPPNPYLRSASASGHDESDYSDSQGPPPLQPPVPAPGLSELDRLFVKFIPPNQAQLLPASSMPSHTPQSSLSAPSVSVQSLFDALRGTDVGQPPPPPLPAPTQSHGAFPPPTQSTGIKLLDTIFASASAGLTPPPPTKPPPQQQLQQQLQQQQPIYYLQPPPSTQNAIHIHSPTPKTTTLPPPQVLSQNVIGSLLGLATTPSRTPSAASSTASYQHNHHHHHHHKTNHKSPSHPSSRDGDNESDSYGGSSSSDGSGGRAAAAQQQQHQHQQHQQQTSFDGGRGKSIPIQIHADPAFRSLGLGVHANSAGPSINGDATPRPSFTPGDRLQQQQNISGGASSTTTTTTSSVNGDVTGKQQQQQQQQPPRNGRPLVPFEPNSELWPYPRQPLDEAGVGASGGGAGGSGRGAAGGAGFEEGDIVELDFEDMSALSDPAAFLRKQQMQAQGKKKGASPGKDKPVPVSVPVSVPAASVPVEGGRKKKEKKKSKKERLEAIAKEKEAIEKSWDFPDVAPVAPLAAAATTTTIGNGHNHNNNNNNYSNGTMNLNGRNVPIPVTFHDDSPPATPSPRASPEPTHQRGPRASGTVSQDTGSVSGTPCASENGTGKKGRAARGKVKRSAAAAAEGVSPPAPPSASSVSPGVQADKALNTLLSGLSAQPEVKRPSAHERNVFVRELLTLIQTDPEFADTLWRNYYAQSA